MMRRYNSRNFGGGHSSGTCRQVLLRDVANRVLNHASKGSLPAGEGKRGHYFLQDSILLPLMGYSPNLHIDMVISRLELCTRSL